MCPNQDIDETTGKPLDRSYLEYGLSEMLQASIEEMKQVLQIIDEKGIMPPHWDDSYCELQSNINCAEVGGEITSEQAWYLREKYLRMRREQEL